MPQQDKGKQLKSRIFPLNTLTNYKYVVVCSFYGGRLVLSRHKQRATWETQGGHIEPGETPLDAAKRELFEEGGITDAELFPVCDYLGYDLESQANGVVFLARVRSIASLPESEMAEIQMFDELPKELTYPNVTPTLMDEAAKRL